MSVAPSSEPASNDESSAHSLASCSSCGIFAYPGDRFCACCGTPLVQNCANCGVAISHPVSNYCTDCGTPIAQQPE